VQSSHGGNLRVRAGDWAAFGFEFGLDAAILFGGGRIKVQNGDVP